MSQRTNPWLLATLEAHALKKAGAVVWVPAWFIGADRPASRKREKPTYVA